MKSRELPIPGLAGIVLCGGASRRMGKPKELLVVDGESLLARTTRVVSEVACPVLVVAARESAIPPDVNSTVQIVRDSIPFAGPLAGMIRGFEALPSDIGMVFVTACDHPFLSSSFVACLADLLGSAEIVLPVLDGMRMPLTAIYRVELLERAKDLLNVSGRGPRDLEKRGVTRVVLPEELDGRQPGLSRSLLSFNTPEEWASLIKKNGSSL